MSCSQTIRGQDTESSFYPECSFRDEVVAVKRSEVRILKECARRSYRANRVVAVKRSEVRILKGQPSQSKNGSGAMVAVKRSEVRILKDIYGVLSILAGFVAVKRSEVRILKERNRVILYLLLDTLQSNDPRSGY